MLVTKVGKEFLVKTIPHSGLYCNVVDDTSPILFEHLDKDEVIKCQAWADEQPEGTIIKSIWHPVVQDQLFINGRGVERR